jgi:hypothetical protein
LTHILQIHTPFIDTKEAKEEKEMRIKKVKQKEKKSGRDIDNVDPTKLKFDTHLTRLQQLATIFPQWCENISTTDI